MQELKHYFQHHKQINIAAIWLLLAAGVMLSLPTATLSLSGLEQWVKDYKGYLFITVIAGIAYFAAVLLVQFSQIAIERHEENEIMTKIQAMVKVMNASEQAVIREFIFQKRDVISLPLEEGAVANLVDNCILIPALNSQEITGVGSKIKLSINIKARHLLDHKSLGIPDGKMTDQQAQSLKKARPAYAKEFYIRH